MGAITPAVSVVSVAPTGAAGGVLGGTYPNPGFAADMATQAELDATTTVEAIHYIGAGGEPAFENTFTNADPTETTYSKAGFYKDRGRVYLVGQVTNTANGVAFTLPAGYRPRKRVFSGAATDGGYSRVDIKTDGGVQVFGANQTQSLEGVYFTAA